MYKKKKGEQNVCLQCGTSIYGRFDKKFCSNNCRTKYHNGIRRKSRLYIGHIITILGTNYKILDNLLAEKKTAIQIGDLEALGYRMAVFTGYSKSRYGHTEIKCFDIRFYKGEERIYDISRIEQ